MPARTEDTLTMIGQLVDQAEAASPEPDQDCPRGRRGTRRCADVCFCTVVTNDRSASPCYRRRCRLRR